MPDNVLWTRVTQFTATTKGRARPFIVSVPALVSVASVASAVYDQVSQLVPV